MVPQAVRFALNQCLVAENAKEPLTVPSVQGTASELCQCARFYAQATGDFLAMGAREA